VNAIHARSQLRYSPTQGDLESEITMEN
jgi:hypothetical protein